MYHLQQLKKKKTFWMIAHASDTCRTNFPYNNPNPNVGETPKNNSNNDLKHCYILQNTAGTQLLIILLKSAPNWWNSAENCRVQLLLHLNHVPMKSCDSTKLNLHTNCWPHDTLICELRPLNCCWKNLQKLLLLSSIKNQQYATIFCWCLQQKEKKPLLSSMRSNAYSNTLSSTKNSIQQYTEKYLLWWNHRYLIQGMKLTGFLKKRHNNGSPCL